MKLIKLIKSKAIWIICVLSFIAAFTYNELNLNHLPTDKIRDNQTVITNDDYSYLYPAEHYIEYGTWKEGANRDQAHYFRPPGYGMLYYVILKTIGKGSSLFFLKLIQLILFSSSVYWLFAITMMLFKDKKTALITASIYGLTPFAVGFLYFTLTEGITPALLLLYVFLLLKGYHQSIKIRKNIFYFGASLIFAYLFITRPVLGVFSLLIPIVLAINYWKTSIKIVIIKSFLMGIVAFSFMAIWQVRNYNIAGEYVGLNPIYDTEQVSMYRPPFKAYWKFTGCWAEKGYVTLSVMDPFWAAAIKGDTAITYIDNILNTYPPDVISYFGEDRLTNVLKHYQQVIYAQKVYLDQEIPTPKKMPPKEIALVKEIELLTNEYQSNFWFKSHILSPIKVFGTMAFHSNLSLYIFQQTYRGNWLMEGVRLLFYILHAMCFIAVLINLCFIKKITPINYGIAICLFIYMFYLCYFQRGLEERYTLPILPLLLVGLMGLLKKGMGFSRR